MTAAEWRATGRRTLSTFLDDKLTHWAGALTYYAVLSIFPGLLVLVSLLGIVGEPVIQPLLEQLTGMAPGAAREVLVTGLENVRDAEGAGTGLAFLLGLAVAVWSASRYVNCFIDAANIIWRAPAERPIWKRLPVRYGLTLLLLVLVALSGLALLVSGPIAREIGDVVGMEETAVRAWDLAKLPVVLLLVSAAIAVLYWAAPNVDQRFRCLTPGSIVAVLGWVAVSLVFGLYVGTIGGFNETYGTFGGIAVFLVWLWLTNIALLLGAVVNSELRAERRDEAGEEGEEPERGAAGAAA
jgi:membrane protein